MGLERYSIVLCSGTHQPWETGSLDYRGGEGLSTVAADHLTVAGERYTHSLTRPARQSHTDIDNITKAHHLPSIPTPSPPFPSPHPPPLPSHPPHSPPHPHPLPLPPSLPRHQGVGRADRAGGGMHGPLPSQPVCSGPRLLRVPPAAWEGPRISRHDCIPAEADCWRASPLRQEKLGKQSEI